MKKLSLTLFLALICSVGFAQKSKLDSVLYLFDQSRTKTGLDTAKFTLAYSKINQLEITDSTIKQIEKAAHKFDKGDNQDLYFYIVDGTASGLYQNAKYEKEIEYLKSNFEKLENSKTPNLDVFRLNFLVLIRESFRKLDRFEEGLIYFNEKINVYKSKNDIQSLVFCHFNLALFYGYIGLFNQEIYHWKKSISYGNINQAKQKIFFDYTNYSGQLPVFNSMNLLSLAYTNNRDFPNALYYAQQVIKGLKKVNVKTKVEYRQRSRRYCAAYSRMAEGYLLINKLDSVEFYLDKSNLYGKETNYTAILIRNLQTRAIFKQKEGKLAIAEALLKECEKSLILQKDNALTTSGVVTPNYVLAEIKIEQKKYDEAIALLNKNLGLVVEDKLRAEQIKTHKLLAEVYEKIGNHEKSAFTYQKFATLQDSLLADQKKYSTISFEIEQQMSEKEQSILKLQSQEKINSLTRNFSIGIAVLLLLLAGGVYARFRSKQKANKILEKTLAELKQTQNQLIQKEKLASLGELTAGIAHEIQNPLNFVNNFSEMSVELIEELKSPLIEASNRPDGGMIDIKSIDMELFDDVVQNLEKINYHGKRASSIVSGMLEHSRTSTGERTLTDLNKLADEYLRLSYHGMRAKDNSFSADYEVIADGNLPKINIVPQDIGRVLLNLINNAFWAVRTVAKPKVVISTLNDSIASSDGIVRKVITIKVIDNGIGMSKEVQVKIFQPFFTTKPTGQGTGLGLSLAYDIVTKGHGGTIEVESVEGEGTTFIVKLPIQTNP